MNDIPHGKQRPRNSDDTRRRLLVAAHDAFASKGYASVGVREIAAAAAADPVLIRRYFGSKEKLYEAALAEALDISAFVDGPREGFGERIASFIDDAGESRNALPMLIFATADATSRVIAQSLLEEQVVAPIARWLGGANAVERAGRMCVLCSGFVLYWRLLPISPLAPVASPQTRAWLAEALQRIVDEGA